MSQGTRTLHNPTRPLKKWKSTNALNDLPTNPTEAQRNAATNQNAAALRKRLGLAEGDGLEAHHIVAGLDDRADESRQLLDRYQIDVNDAVNGIPLRGSAEDAAKLNPGIRKHHGTLLHSEKGHAAVEQRLRDAVAGEKDWAKAREALLKELAKLKDEIRSGAFPANSIK